MDDDTSGWHHQQELEQQFSEGKKMKVHSKLNEARIKLQGAKLNKSGHNKFAGYTYFELGDFLPAVNKIFSDIGLCGVVSYGENLATLTITSIDDDSSLTITSPMADANLKGCHPIQNLGAVETYTRRYLWVTALEIVEHDALDSSKPLTENVQSILEGSPYGELDEESVEFLNSLAIEVNAMNSKTEIEAIYKKVSNLLNVEKVYINKLLNSAARSAIKSYKENMKEAP